MLTCAVAAPMAHAVTSNLDSRVIHDVMEILDCHMEPHELSDVWPEAPSEEMVEMERHLKEQNGQRSNNNVAFDLGLSFDVDRHGRLVVRKCRKRKRKYDEK